MTNPLLNSIIVTSATMFIVLVLGMCIGFFVYSIRKSRWFYIVFLLILVPLIITPQLHALSFRHFFLLMRDFAFGSGKLGIYTIPSVVYIYVLSYTPLVVLATYIGLVRIPHKLVQQAQSIASYGKILFKLLIPQIILFPLAALLLVGILVVRDFSVPAYLHIQVIPYKVFLELSRSYDLGQAFNAGLPIFAISLILILVYLILNKRLRFIESSHDKPLDLQDITPQLIGISLSILTFLFILLGAIMPIGTNVIQMLDVRNVSLVLELSTSALLTTIILSLSMGILITFVSWIIHKVFNSKMMRIGLLVLFALPSSIIALFLLSAVNGSIISWVSHTILILLVGYTLRYGPLGYEFVYQALARFPQKTVDSAKLTGKRSLPIFMKIEFPLQFPILLVTVLITTFFVAQDLTTTLLLQPAGIQTLTQKIYVLLHYGDAGAVALLVLCMIFYNLLLFVALWYLVTKVVWKTHS